MSIWNSALNILARREHSEAELRTKLQVKFPESDSDIADVLSRLQEQGLQSDLRYTEMWLRSQVSKGRGPVRIRYEARQKGIEKLIESVICDSDIDWFELASDCLCRRFSDVDDPKERARAYRYLSYRGFGADMIQYAIDNLKQP